MTRYDELILEMKRREDMMDCMRGVLTTHEGQMLMYHIFKMLEVLSVPEAGLEGNDLHRVLGSMDAGNKILKIALEAYPSVTNTILTKIDAERVASIKDELNNTLERLKYEPN